MSSNTEQDERNIFVAISAGAVHRLHSIVANVSDLNIRDQSLRTPLLAAVAVNDDEVRSHVVRLLLRHKCDVNAQDMEGRTALMLACMDKGKADVAGLLMKTRECDPNIQDLDGNTALHLAVERGNAEAIRALTGTTATKSMVRINEPNQAGLCPLQLAVKLRHADCCRILIKYGGADTTLVKNREALLELINEDRAQTPFEFHRSPTPAYDSSPINSARFNSSGMSRPSSDIMYRGGSRANSSTSLTRPASDLNSARESARMRNEAYSRLSESFPRADSRGSRTDFHTKSGKDMSNPFADIMREKSDLYVNNSRTTFKKSIVPKTKSKQTHGDWLRQNLSIRRPLTPIASRTITEETCISPAANQIPLPGRLPSIPSGKRLCLVSPCETPTELF